MRPAGLNRRMRKTACPVVWEDQRAQSRWFDPIQLAMLVWLVFHVKVAMRFRDAIHCGPYRPGSP